ncbi:hypothetical protein NUV26_12725 [Burkholderia pseudomultivorans]|uniref:hypothetical protein n=1 Tax=Burkholderia pseudomultivorans TaxID=1207504 RepID=UPI0012DAD6F6|nr:hypothetical protein [Burkholderia pseudomultivorans]MDS0793022.1 hypothetical protein [Burkholderia pseudomultivorans]
MSIAQGKHFRRAGIAGITLNSLEPLAYTHDRSASLLDKVAPEANDDANWLTLVQAIVGDPSRTVEPSLGAAECPTRAFGQTPLPQRYERAKRRQR